MRIKGHTTQAASVLSLAAAVAARVAHERSRTARPGPVAPEPAAPAPAAEAPRFVEPAEAPRVVALPAAEVPPLLGASSTTSSFFFERVRQAAGRVSSAPVRADEPFALVLDEPPGWGEADAFRALRVPSGRIDDDDDRDHASPRVLVLDESFSFIDEPFVLPPPDQVVPPAPRIEPAAPPVELSDPERLGPPRWVSAGPSEASAEGSWAWDEQWAFERPAPYSSAPRPPRTPREPGSAWISWRFVRRGIVLLLAGLIVAWLVAAYIHRPGVHASRAARGHQAADELFSGYAQRTIPPAYRRIYTRVGAEYGLDPAILAAVGTIESGNGTAPMKGVSSGTHAAGSVGPAQFQAKTWARYGVDASGTGSANPYDPVDAITAMAAYLKAAGAPENWTAALIVYSHSSSYAQSVLALAPLLRAHR